MLVLGRKVNQKVQIGNATITICAVRGQQVKIGIEAPPDVHVSRPADQPPAEKTPRGRDHV